MEMAVWILFCLFASIGIVQCGSWIAGALKRPQDVCNGYFLLPLYDDVETLEARMRYGFYRAQKYADNETVLFMDMGLGAESAKICEKLLPECPGVYISEKAGLAAALERLEGGLQEGPDDVE